MRMYLKHLVLEGRVQHIFGVEAGHVLDAGHMAQAAVVVDDHTSFGPERDARAGREINNG